MLQLFHLDGLPLNLQLTGIGARLSHGVIVIDVVVVDVVVFVVVVVDVGLVVFVVFVDVVVV